MRAISLIAKRQEDLHGGHPDYHVFAGEQIVGRIYKTHFNSATEGWFWGVNSVTFDLSLGGVMQGHASSFEDARAKLRVAFDKWLVWARAMPKDDLKYREITTELWKMGERG